jgi:hypothetical protein
MILGGTILFHKIVLVEQPNEFGAEWHVAIPMFPDSVGATW